MTRDWLRAFRPASFRGVPFFVEIEEASGRRRLCISPIAYAESSVIEDMGRDPSAWTLDAYTLGDYADQAARALMAALDAKGPGLLVLPMLGGKRARVTGWSMTRQKRAAGYVGFSVQFVEEGLGAIPFAAPAAGAVIAQIVSSGIAYASSALEAAVKSIPASRRASLSDRALGALDRAGTAAALAGGSEAPAVSAAIGTLEAVAPLASSDPGAWAAAQVDTWRALAVFNDPALVMDQAASQSVVDDGKPETAIEIASNLCGLTIAAARREYAASQDAAEARDTISAATDAALIPASRMGGDFFTWLSDAAGQAAVLISRQGATRAPLVRVEVGMSLPSVALAYALYGDGTRAGDLVARNRVSTPALMPAEFEAESP